MILLYWHVKRGNIRRDIRNAPHHWVTFFVVEKNTFEVDPLQNSNALMGKKTGTIQ